MGKTKDILLKAGIEVARIILAITFIFSGFVKSIDPLGTVYKIQDYLTAFGLSELHGLALFLSVLLCAGEFCLGMFMLIGLYRKWTSRLMLLVMLFMTPLTLYLAIANPVEDCGCFGDALIISNWQTFYKNIVLLACSVIVLIWHEKITNLFTGKFYWFVALYIIIFGIGFCLYNYYNEPIIDFRPYKIGNNIPELMTVEEGKAPVYKNILIYQKDGVEKEFTEDNYPWEDSTWVFVDRVSRIIKEGEIPVIEDFSINRLFLNPDKTEIEYEENITDELLSDSTYTFLMIAYSLEDMRDTYLSRFEDVNNYAKDYNYKFYCLTSSPRDSILKLEKENITNFDFCAADERVLKTITRSNPGLILLKEGIVINKWADRDVPDENQLKKPIEELAFSKMPDTSATTKRRVSTTIMVLLLPLLGVKIFDALLYQRKKTRQRVDEEPDKTKEI
ncbi:MAG: DoxX family protein [Dysgonomonas sp.]|nr:DoxX family protein [Dysgonomonas sp.]